MKCLHLCLTRYLTSLTLFEMKSFVSPLRRFTQRALIILSFFGMAEMGWGQTTYTFSSLSWAASPANWTPKANGNAYVTSQGIQVTTLTTGACGNSPISFNNVTSVRVGYCTNASSGAGTIKVFSVASSSALAQSGTQIGSTTSVSTIGGTAIRYLTFNTSAITGNIQIYASCTTNSIYIASVDIYASPAAPSISAITAGNASLSVAFTAGSNGGYSISNYKYSTDGGSSFTACSPVQTTSPIVISGLTNGTTYNVQIKAVNSAGDGTATGSTAATPATTPDAPTINAITASNGQLSVAFIAGTTGGSAITSYKYSTDGGTTFRIRATGTTASPLVISTLSSDGTTALTNGTSYNIQIKAVNAQGDGSATGSTAATPYTISGAPTIGTATVSGVSGTANVPFTAPSSNGGSAITSYTATSSPGGFTGSLSQAGSGTITVTGLTNGTAYTFTVKANNAAGASNASSVSNSVTPYTVPDAPTIGAAVAGNGTADVTFTAPSFNGGSAITGYTVTSTPAGITGTGTVSPITVSGLTNGTSYTFTVTAANSAGSSSASSSSNSVTPSSGPTVPGAPTAVSAVRGNSQATVSFTAPASDGGSAITSYTVTSSPGGFMASGASSPLTVSGLTNGTSYTFTVVATNSIGSSLSSSASSSIIPATTPSAPTITGITAGNAQLTVLFTAPSSNVGDAITNYKYSTDGGSTFTTVSPASTSSPIVITGLANGTAYNIQILAVNTVGDGAASTTSTQTPATTPGSPTITGITTGNGQLSVAFTAPTSTGGSSITNYKYSTNGGSTFTAVSPASIASPIVITGLTNGTSYNVQIRAVNAMGDGTATASTSATPFTIPDAPTIGTATAGNGQVSIAYTAPASNGGSAITSYTAISSPGGFTGTVSQATSGSIVVTGLTNGTAYTFTVTATNSAGTSSASSASASSTPRTSPDAPIIGAAAVAGISGTATVTFTAPSFNGGSAITSYTATSSPGGITGTVSQSGSGTITISGLTNGTAYTFTVSATNVAGVSSASASSNSVTPYTVPGAPTIGTATAGNGQATISFTAPVSNGGSTITSFTATSSPGGITGTLSQSGSGTITVTGLTNGTAYTFTVTATNAAGTSTASAASNSINVSLPVPTASAATSILNNGFTANWSEVAGASSGYLLDVSTSSTFGTVEPLATDLFISEYVEGSSNNKYIEIFNGTGNTIDLSLYELGIANNGATVPSYSSMSGSLANGATVVYKNASSTLTLPNGVLAINNGACSFNGDDAIVLHKVGAAAATFVDVIGRVGDDPGTNWSSTSNSTLDKTLRRNSSVIAGVTSSPTGTGPGAFLTLESEWTQFNVDVVSGLGSHSIPTSVPLFVTGYNAKSISGQSTVSSTVTGLSESTTYYYRVRATDGSTSANSNVITVTTKQTPTVTPTVGTYTYTGSAQGPNAATNTGTGTSYTFSYAGSGATAYGPIATLPTNAGSYTVTATVAADGNYVSASSSATAFTIGVATPVVTATIGTYTYSGSAQGPNAATNTGTGTSYTFSYAGTGSTTYGPSATLPTNAGTYTVTATVAANGNYGAASSSATAFNIAKASSSISVTGTTDYAYSGSAQGPSTSNVTGSTGAVTYSYIGVSGTTYAASATKPTNVGSYTVTATVAADANYLTATSEAYSFTISTATPTITVTVGTYTYNGTAQGPTVVTGNTGNGTVTWSYAGVSPTVYSASATAPTNAGTYTATASVAANGNYGVASSSATAFTISPAALTITANNQSKCQGETLTFAGTEFSASATLPSGATVALASDGAVSTAPAGTYSIVPSIGGTGIENYSVTSTPGTLTVNATGTWIGGTNNWNNDLHWCGEVPISTSSVVIPTGSVVTLDITTEISNLTIESGGSLIIQSFKTLTVSGTITNNGTFDIQSGGQLLQTSDTDISGSGTCIFRKSLPQVTNTALSGYNRSYYIGSPVVGASSTTPVSIVSVLGSSTTGLNMYGYTETNNSWPLYYSGSEQIFNSTFGIGKGYFVNSSSGTYFSQANFTGNSFNNGDVTVTLTNTTGQGGGYNLISNPYPSGIDWSSIYGDASNTSLVGSSYWLRTYDTGGAGMVYKTCNASGVSTQGINTTISPATGFWVKYTGTSPGTFTFKNAMRTSGAGTYYTMNANHIIRLDLGNGSYNDQAVVYMNEDAGLGIEAFDSDKRIPSTTVHQLYTLEGTTKLAINGFNNALAKDTVLLGMQIPTAGTYSINASQIDATIEEDVFLEDKITGAYQNLKITPSYTFTSTQGTFNNRFVLHFAPFVPALPGQTAATAIAMPTSNWPQCNNVSTEDKWHAFTATTEGISIAVNTTTTDLIIELQDENGNVVAQENAVNGIGNETLNFYGLTAGQTYKVGVRNNISSQPTGTYGICVKSLKRGGCDYGAGPYSLCQYYKATWAGSTGVSYTFTFTGTSGPAAGQTFTRTQNSDICVLSTVTPLLPYGSTYDVVISNTYTLTDGAGNTEQVTVPSNSGCQVVTIAQPQTTLSSSSSCSNGARFRGAVVSSMPWVCGANNWRWRFTEVNPLTLQTVGLPIELNRGTASNYLSLASVAQLQNGKTYAVETAPMFAYTGTNYQWGPTQYLCIVGASQDALQDVSQDASQEAAQGQNKDAVQGPSEGASQESDVLVCTTTGQQIKVWTNIENAELANATVRIYNSTGSLVYAQRMSSNEMLIDLNTAAGLYIVEVGGVKRKVVIAPLAP